jgi:hypothetical protein
MIRFDPDLEHSRPDTKSLRAFVRPKSDRFYFDHFDSP